LVTSGKNVKAKAKKMAELEGTGGVSVKSAAIAEVKGKMVKLN
jgi:hypothetical protein